jgi:hypothetical protein
MKQEERRELTREETVARVRRRLEQEAEEPRRLSLNKLARRFWALRRRAYTIDEYAVTVSPSYITIALWYLFSISVSVFVAFLFLKDFINGELKMPALFAIFFIIWVIYWSCKGVIAVGSAISEAQSGSIIHINGASQSIIERPWLRAKRSSQSRVIPFQDVTGVEVSYESRHIGGQEQLVWKLSLRLQHGQEIELGQAGGTWHNKNSPPSSPKEPRSIIELSQKIATLTRTPVTTQPRADWWREEPK